MNMEQFLSVWAVLHGDIEQLTTYSYVNSGLDMTGYVSAWNSMAWRVQQFVIENII